MAELRAKGILHEPNFKTGQVLEKLDAGVRSLVVYGEPQSGKTEFMIALVCKLLDSGKKTILF